LLNNDGNIYCGAGIAQVLHTYCNFNPMKNNKRSMKKLLFCVMLSVFTTAALHAQETGVTRTPEEQRELFNYCDKPFLINKLKISSETADKIGDLNLWQTQQQKTIDDNTNETYATAGELQQEINKRLKKIGLSDDQVKTFGDYKRAQLTSPEPCAAIALYPNPAYDTLTPQRALLLLKQKYRKVLIEKLGETGNGKMADMVIETEVWKQKESLTISKIPLSDFNRVRRTVSMYKERDNKYRGAGLDENQANKMIEFFRQNQLYAVAN
jgi:hypothetical protein